MSTGVSAFIDTTIHVDRVLRRHDTNYMQIVDSICATYDICITSTFSKLEFKNVVLMDLQCVAQWIEEENSYVAAYERALRVQSRRSKTLANVAAFVQRQVDHQIEVRMGESLDAKLMEQSLIFINNAIEYLWYRFDVEVDSISDYMKCQRVLEGPSRNARSGRVSVRNQQAQCRSMKCNVVGFYQASARRVNDLVKTLREMDASGDARMTAELREIVTTHDKVATNRNQLFDYSTCLGLGDLWNHLEAVRNGASAVITRNKKESCILCPELGMQMVDPDAAQQVS